jgi:hypothetical protein
MILMNLIIFMSECVEKALVTLSENAADVKEVAWPL